MAKEWIVNVQVNLTSGPTKTKRVVVTADDMRAAKLKAQDYVFKKWKMSYETFRVVSAFEKN